jgi:hypothetical protein
MTRFFELVKRVSTVMPSPSLEKNGFSTNGTRVLGAEK